MEKAKQKPWGAGKTALAVGATGAVASTAVGVVGTGMAAANSLGVVKSINAEKKIHPYQSISDNYVFEGVKTVRNGVAAAIAGISAGSALGTAVGAGAGLFAGKSKTGKLILGSAGAILGSVAGAAVLAGTTYIGLEKNRLNQAKEKSERVINCETDLYRMGKKAGLNPRQIYTMMKTGNEILSYINNTQNSKEDREKLWNALRNDFPLQAPSFDDSSNPTTISELFEQATVGLQKQKVQDSLGQEIPSVTDLITQFHNFSSVTSIPQNIHEMDISQYGLGESHDWTKNPEIKSHVFNDEKNPYIKRQINSLVNDLPPEYQQKILTALGGKNSYLENIDEILNVSNPPIPDMRDRAIRNLPQKNLFVKYPHVVIRNIVSNQYLMNDIISASDAEDHLQSLADRNIERVFSYHHQNKIDFIDSVNLDSFRSRLSDFSYNKSRAVFNGLSNKANALSRFVPPLPAGTNPTAQQLRDNMEEVIAELAMNDNDIRALLRRDILSFSALLEVNKDEIISDIVASGNLPHSFKEQKIKELLSENPQSLIEIIERHEGSSFNGYIVSDMTISDSFIKESYNDNVEDLFRLLDDDEQKEFWANRRTENPNILAELLHEKSSLEIFNALPRRIQKWLANAIEKNPEANGDALVSALSHVLVQPLIIGETENVKSMVGISKLLDAHHTSASESAEGENTSITPENIMTKIKENIHAAVPMISVANDVWNTGQQVVGTVRDRFGKKSANDTRHNKTA